MEKEMSPMELYQLCWFANYMPCHDHRIPPKNGPYIETDYWLVMSVREYGLFSLMQTEIRRP